MLFLASFAIASDLTTYDPASWVTWGLAPSTARELADPVTTPKVGPSGILNIGFGTEDVGGGGLYRGGTTRVFLGVEAAGEGYETTTPYDEEEEEEVTYARSSLPLQLDVATRRGEWGFALRLSEVRGTTTLRGGSDGTYEAGETYNFADAYAAEGGLVAQEADGRILVQWGPTSGDVRPRFAGIVRGASSVTAVDYSETSPMEYEGTIREHWEGEGRTWLEGSSGLPYTTNMWRAGGGVRGGVDLAGTNEAPRTRVWVAVEVVGGGPVIDSSTYTREDEEGLSSLNYAVRDASAWDASFEVGWARKLGGEGAGAWLSAAGQMDYGGMEQTSITTVDGNAGESIAEASTDLDGSVGVTLTGFVDLAPTFRLSGGIEPYLVWSAAREAEADAVGTSSYLDTNWSGRMALEWHHPTGFLAAIALGWSESSVSAGSSSAASLFGSNTALWIGWVPE